MKTIEINENQELLSFIKKDCITKGFPIEGINFIDIFPLMQQCYPADIEASGMKMESVVFLPEARGFLYYTWAKQFGSVIPCRKSGKLPGELWEIVYEKEYGADKLYFQKAALESAVRRAAKNGNVIEVSIFDDILATGGTMAALINAVNAMTVEVDGVAYNLKVKSVGCYIELTELPGRALLEGLGVDVFTVYRLNTEEL